VVTGLQQVYTAGTTVVAHLTAGRAEQSLRPVDRTGETVGTGAEPDVGVLWTLLWMITVEVVDSGCDEAKLRVHPVDRRKSSGWPA
jgi:hypothetical protein